MAERRPGRGHQGASFDDMRQQRTLGEYPGEWVNLECLREDCTRRGRLRKAGLLEKYGPNIGLVDLINLLRPKDCPKNVRTAQGFNHCAACYGPELLAAAGDISTLLNPRP